MNETEVMQEDYDGEASVEEELAAEMLAIRLDLLVKPCYMHVR